VAVPAGPGPTLEPDAADAGPAQEEREPSLDPGIDKDASPTPAADGAARGTDAPVAAEDADEDEGGDASIESIVQDLKRERGQS
jgi:hypothetical protein